MDKSSGYPYPNREHLKDPTTPEDIISDELRTGSVGAEFRWEVIAGLGTYYGGLLYTQVAKQRAEKLGLARTRQAECGSVVFAISDEDRASAFYVGALLAMHANLSLDPRLVDVITNLEYEDVAPRVKTTSELEEWYVNDLTLSVDEMNSLLHKLPSEERDVLASMAARAYEGDDSVSAQGCQFEMIFGYVYASHDMARTYRRVRGEEATNDSSLN